MDDMTERKCINALKAVIRPEHTVVLVTHKPALLELVNRIVVVNSLGQGIVRIATSVSCSNPAPQ